MPLVLFFQGGYQIRFFCPKTGVEIIGKMMEKSGCYSAKDQLIDNQNQKVKIVGNPQVL